MISIEALSASNLHHLVVLYRQVFGKKVDVNFVQGKMDASRLGLGYFGHLALEEDQPVAYYGAVPFAMTLDGKMEIGAQSGDAMTLPSHAGKGLFTQLGEATDQQLEQAGVRFVWGFPNQNSEYGYTRKLHWQHMHRMHAYRFSVRSLPVEAVARKTGWTGQVYRQWAQKRLQVHLSKKAAFPGSVAGDGFGGSLRDAAFFEYKQFTPNFILELEGKQVWISLRSGLWVGDLEIMSQTEFARVLERLKTLAGQLGLKEVVFQFSPNTHFDRILSKNSSPTPTWIAGYKNYSSDFELDRLRFSFGDLDTF